MSNPVAIGGKIQADIVNPNTTVNDLMHIDFNNELTGVIAGEWSKEHTKT